VVQAIEIAEAVVADPKADPGTPGVEPRGGRPRDRRRKPSAASRQRVGLVYVAPPLVLFAVVILVPVARGIWISLHDWNGVSPARWAGLHNYATAFTDPAVRQAFLHSLVLVACYSAIPVCIGLLLTAVLARRPIRWLGFWRTLLFLPQVTSVVVVGVAWQWLLQEDGPVNQILRLIGLGSWTRVWLGDFTWALPSEGAIGTWLMSGLCMVLFLAGAQSIDSDLYDAASVDGAGRIREFFAVTVPGLRNVIVVASILTFAVSLNNFALIWVTTKGGPGTQTQVTSTLIYNRAFVLQDLGGASALAVILGIIMMAVSFGISRLSEDT
jgi:raffinose/stachyose/melibiose transport system permease protein